ncbi:M64 family metallopeptidase [Mucilaginibacter sp. CAU 1740]|uniref:M64 family metallopeptidase n=1 Tax=Mucilaginibacter sp. CAU 1740 TaxID=3140365 RepID=UPI00325AA0A5
MTSKTALSFLLLIFIFLISCKKDKPVPTSPYYTDGEVSKLNYNRQNGVNIIFIGDGFTKEDLKKGGAYETHAREFADFLFTIPPYKQYKSFFNTYVVYAESKKSGLNASFDPANTDTKFNAYFSGGSTGLLLAGNYQAINEYVSKAVPRAKANIIILMVNTDTIDAATGSYDGFAEITVGPLAKYAMIHELGHAFASLGDEYVFPEIADNYPLDMVPYLPNLDTTNDPKKVKWADFLNRNAYRSVIGIYQGGYYRATGIYRPEEVSVMQGTGITLHYNAPSRLAIVKKIDEITGTPFNMDNFLENDAELIPLTLLPPLNYKPTAINDFIGIEKIKLQQKQNLSVLSSRRIFKPVSFHCNNPCQIISKPISLLPNLKPSQKCLKLLAPNKP